MLKIIKLFFFLFVLSVLLVLFPLKPVFAGELAIVLNDLPAYENITNFRLSYTAIETDQLPIKVNLYIQKEGKDWRQTVAKDKTDFAGEFQLEGSDLYDNEGKYYFKAIVESTGRTLESNVTSATLDMSAPSAPTEFGKERVNASTFKLTWKNPFDEDFEKVYVYRSKEKSFTADSGTRIGDVGGAKEEKMTFNDGSVPEPDVEYYYALRALDYAGNASGIVTDAPGVVSGGQVAGASTGTGGSTSSTGKVVLLPEEKGAVTPAEEAGEGELGGGGATEGEVKGESTPKSKLPYVLGGLGIIIIVLVLYFLLRKKEA